MLPRCGTAAPVSGRLPAGGHDRQRARASRAAVV